jgi:hypothetical protein
MLGGPGYQALAVALTYLSIVGAYYIVILVELDKLGRLTGESALAVVPYAAGGPFLGGADNLIGMLIVGFGLYQAWKMNKRVPRMTIAGPFPLPATGDGG